MVKRYFDSKQFRPLVSDYYITHKGIADQARGRFFNVFSLKASQKIDLDDYLISSQKPTFCDQVEAKNRPW
jgi:hypothetical protein